ncbi:WD repeat-containing protein C17D11.16 [Apiospora hydei]|uniref:WD repeat-containing protein C17D11.16 n=1 Tax=Apiospora hydei TaxID=1337664 RepID=A0ABR1X2Q9_9PEZI
MSSMITTASWYTFDEAEFERIAELAKLQLDDANEDLEEAQEEKDDSAKVQEEDGASTKNAAKDGAMDEDEEEVDVNDDDLKEYDLEHYDDDEEDQPEGQKMDMFGNVKSLAYYESNKEDPYITIPDGQDDEDEDREDLQILATDNLLLAAKVEDELAHLEVYVYEDEADNLYVHHDIMLPAIPLCVEWLDVAVGKQSVEQQSSAANFVAIGTMDPDIEIWDLDTSKKANDEYHVDAVLSLAANRQHRNLLASASADKTVKLWDLNTTKCAKSYSYHTDKVCSLAWHTVESTVLLSGSYDRTIVAADMRAPDAKVHRWGVESDVENVRWDPHDPNCFFVSTENGIIHYHDARNAPSSPSESKPLWTLQAHDESLSSFDVNSQIPGFMATGSTDKTVKLWNITPTGPQMVVSRNLDVGRVFSATFAPDVDVAFRLAVAGSKGTMHIWDTSTNASVRKAFGSKMNNKPDAEFVEDKLVGVAADDSSSDSDEGDEDEEDDDDDEEDDQDDNDADSMDED